MRGGAARGETPSPPRRSGVRLPEEASRQPEEAGDADASLDPADPANVCGDDGESGGERERLSRKSSRSSGGGRDMLAENLYVCVCVCVCVRACVYKCAGGELCALSYMYTHNMYVHTHITCMYTHTNTHTHTHRRIPTCMHPNTWGSHGTTRARGRGRRRRWHAPSPAATSAR